MSSNNWVKERLREGFEAYRTYLSMSLHFRDGNGYDFPTYNGANTATMGSLQKSPDRLTYVRIYRHIPDGKIIQFLFSNFRSGNRNIHQLKGNEAVDVYNRWDLKYGTDSRYDQTVFVTVRKFYVNHPEYHVWNIDLSVILGLLSNLHSDADYGEAVIWILQKSKTLAQELDDALKDNVVLRMEFNRLKKLQSFYIWLGLV